MTLLYFAWLRQKIGCSEENLPLPAHVHTIAELAEFLRGRGAGYAEAFADPGRLRAARNQDHVTFDVKLRDEDEIAFFPPVTGG
ncbi:MAG TPA: molybdopterin converting factor subunit 1 [Rhizomicrobium sp.]